MRLPRFHVVLQIAGIAAIITSVLGSMLPFQTPGFGIVQLSGVTLGLITLLEGLYESKFRDEIRLTRLLLIFFIAGLLLVGLWPHSGSRSAATSLLAPTGASLQDSAMNVLGFLPLGYLAARVLALGSTKGGMSASKRASVVLAMGVALSLVIEISQYLFVPGRFSAMHDTIANGLGTLCGISLFSLGRYWDATVATAGRRRSMARSP